MKKRELVRKKKELKAKLEENKAIVSEAQREGTAIHREIKSIDKELNKGIVTVSDHAVLRYMERVNKVDIEEIREEILDSIPCFDCTEGIKDMNVLKGAHKLVIKDNVVVTVSPK